MSCTISVETERCTATGHLVFRVLQTMIVTAVVMNTMVRVLTAEFLDLAMSCVIDVANSQVVNSADATCPSVASVENRFTFVRYCSKIQYRIYSLW